MVNINNLFDFCDDSIQSTNVLYTIGNLIGNSTVSLAIKHDNGKIMTYSSEWLYLIKCYYPNQEMYNQIINYYNKIRNIKFPVKIINESTLSFITSFSTGTVHGYSGLYYMLCEYIDNYEKYKDFKILLYKNSQTGILNIIEHLCNKNIIDRNKIIYLDKNVIYHINNINFIPNIHHIFNIDLAERTNRLIEKYISVDRNDLNYYNSLNLSKNTQNICIIKGTTSTNLTKDCIFQNNDIINFCNNWNLNLIEPNVLDEIHLIHYINQCKHLVISWGTSFLKNFVYISDNCERITVLVMDESIFLVQYKCSPLLKKFKNAEIIYKIVNQNLIFNLLE
jgi:hypothetical protein